MKEIHPATLAARLLRRESAARYLSISPSKFDELTKTKAIPAPRILQNMKAWDRQDLDTFIDSLPYESEANPWDG